MPHKTPTLKPFFHKWSLITLAIGVFITVLAMVQTNYSNMKIIQSTTQEFSNHLIDDVVRRFELYQYGLRGARGTIVTAGEFGISRLSFQKYSSTRDVDVEFPGALGFGFIRRVPQKDITTFLVNAREDDWSDFKIKELSINNNERYVIQYIEPIDRNAQAIGLDIASERNRREAARSALLSGEVRLSGPITLVQATGQSLQSFLILMPIYSTGVDPGTDELRDQYGYGWSYAPLITSQVLADLGIESNFHQIELTDITDSGNAVVFFSNYIDSSNVVYSKTDNIFVYGRNWQLKIGVLPEFVSGLHLVNSATVGVLGFILTLLTAGLVGSNAASRASRAAAVAEQSKLASIVSSSADGIISLTREGYITSWNSGAKQILGFTSSEVIGHSYLKLIVPENLREQSLYLIDKANKGHSVASLETLRNHKDGRQIPISVSVSPIFLDRKTVSGISVIVRDISLQKQTEQKIKDLNLTLEAQVEERTAEALHVRDQLVMASEAAELGVWVWNGSTDELEWNDMMFEIYGYPISLREEGVKYAHWLNRIHPDDQDAVGTSLQKALKNEVKWNSNFRVVWPNGQIRHISARALVEFDDNGTPLSVTGINRDITAEVELEQSLRAAKQKSDEANTAKSTFLSNMSHELRTPMNAVIGMLTLLKNTDLNSRQKDYVTKSTVAAKSLLNVLNDILDYSKIDAGKMELDPHPFEVDLLLQELASILSGVRSDGKVEILFDIDKSVPENLTGDRMRLLQVLINLTNNALKFTEQGHVILHLSSPSRTEEAINILVSIEDTGIGISSEQQGRIFSGFSQAEASTARRYGGTGLGLIISRSLIELMGGQLHLSSELGKGSRFSFELPFGLDKQIPQQIKNYPQYQSIRVLLCEEHPSSRRILAETLSIYCSSVTSVSSGYEALSIVLEQDKAQKSFDIIFMDWHMPGMDGLQTSKAILEADGLTKQPKIVMVTAYDERDLEQLINSDKDRVFVDYIVKPATPLQLKHSLDRVVQPDAFDVTEKRILMQRERGLSGVKVLLVEDNDFNRQIAMELLEIEGANVTLAEGGLAGVDHILKGAITFDVVLMDMQMPDIDGLEATRRIRLDDRFSALPIIALTANVSTHDVEDCLNSGMNDHIGKPIDVAKMIETIKQYLPATFFDAAPEKLENTVIVSDHRVDKLLKTEVSSIDLAGVLERLGDNIDLFKTLLALYERNTDKLFDDLVQQWRNNDLSSVVMTLHSLKGSSSNIGAVGLANFASDWESELKQQLNNSTETSDLLMLELDIINQLKQLHKTEVSQLLTALNSL